MTRIKGVAAFAFGERAGSGLAALAEVMEPRPFTDLFLAIWGAKECEIKANRPVGGPVRIDGVLQERPRTTDYLARIEETPGAFFLFFDAPAGEAMAFELYRSKDFRLTVLAPQLPKKPKKILEKDRSCMQRASPPRAVFRLVEPDDICRIVDPQRQ